jgi:hypothetical protein
MKMLAALPLLLLASAASSQTLRGTGGSPGEVLAQNGGLDVSGNVSTTDSANDGEHRICRRVEADSRSRMSTRRLCLTPAQWRDRQRTN